VAFIPDGRSFASVSSGKDIAETGEVKVWDSRSGNEILELPGHPRETNKIGSIVFSPDGRRLVTACGDNAVHVYDLASRRRIHRLEGHSASVLAAEVSPDGRTIASTGDDTTIKLWDMATGAEIRTLRGHRREVCHLAFSSDGTRLASGSNDETVKLWDLASGQEILTLRGHADVVKGIAFSPDGQRLASCSRDGTIKIWEAAPLTPELKQQRLAAALVNGPAAEGLTRDELIERFRADTTLDDSVRKQALDLAERMPEDPDRLFTLAMNVIAQPGKSAEQYAQALSRAESAARLVPTNVNYENMVGMGQYRVGQYDKAATILEKADAIYVSKGIPRGGTPYNLAFLAMTYDKLGKSAEAKAALERLRERMKQPAFAKSSLYQAMLREAEAQIEGTSPEPK
jgi:hypothetical protein